MTGIVAGIGAGLLAHELIRQLDDTDEQVREALERQDIETAVAQANKSDVQRLRDVLTAAVMSNQHRAQTTDEESLTQQEIEQEVTEFIQTARQPALPSGQERGQRRP